jgi:hypothetical protein
MSLASLQLSMSKIVAHVVITLKAVETDSQAGGS